MSCYFQLQLSDLFEDVLKLLGHVIEDANVPVVDDNLLGSAAGILFGALADFDALDEGMEKLRGQLIYLRVLPCVLQETVEVGGGVLQFLQMVIVAICFSRLWISFCASFVRFIPMYSANLRSFCLAKWVTRRRSSRTMA